MKQQRKRIRKCIAILMTLAMVISLGSGITLPRQAQAAGYGLSDPVTDSTGVTTWDCVYFGNYYQSDATGTTKEPIKWRVLSVDGDDAFLLADQNLDAKPYNTSYTSVTWETCTLRSWLNGYGASANVEETDYSSDNFLDTAFTAEERAAIRQTTVVNEDNYGTEGGNDTTDQVYLLSIAEASNAEYGFNSEFQTESKTREAKNTVYAKSQGAWAPKSEEYEGDGCWWLRLPGSLSGYASGVSSHGWGSYYYYYVDIEVVTVRPVLHLNLSSASLWSYAGKVSSEEGSSATTEPAATAEPAMTKAPNPAATATTKPTAEPATTATAQPATTKAPNPAATATTKPTTEPATTEAPNPAATATTKPTAQPDQTGSTGTVKKNPVKKLSGIKKLTIKRGTAKKVTIKVEAKNNARKTTDQPGMQISNKKRITVSAKKLEKGKYTFKIRAKKKGKVTITIKIGKKKHRIQIECK